MVDKTGIIPGGWSEKLPLRQLVYKSESYLHARGVKYADEKNKDGRKPHRNEKYKEPDLRGDGRKQFPQMVLLTSRSNRLTWKYKTGKSMWSVTSYNINSLLNSTSKNHRNLWDNLPVAATTAGWKTTTTNNVANWSTSRERPRSNIINAIKGGNPIHLRDVVHQHPLPPMVATGCKQGAHKVHTVYNMQHRKK